MDDPVVNYFSATTDFLYEVNISRKKSHQDLCKFDEADEQFQAMINEIKKETDPDLVKFLSTLRSMAPSFRIVPDDRNRLGVIQDVKEFNSCLTNDKSSAIYLHSKPGTSKSVFGSTLFRAQQSLNRAAVIYYSFSARDIRRTTTTSLLCSLIYQTLSPNVLKLAKIEDHYSIIQKLSLWTSSALWILFMSILARPRIKSLLCIVNRVHNWDSSSEPFLRQLVKHLESSLLPIPTRFIFIGELRQNFSNLLQPFPTIQLDGLAFPRGFAQAYADSLITRLVDEKPFLLALDFKKRLKERLHACEDLVRLSVTVEFLGQGICSGIMPAKTRMIDTEQEGGLKVLPAYKLAPTVEIPSNHQHGEPLYTPKSFRAELQLLPYDMPSLIAATFNSLPDWAINALSWILYAQRPMKIGELAEALALIEHESGIELNEDDQFIDLSEDLKSVFGPLLEIHDHDVSLRHEQVKDIFLQIIKDNQKKLADEQSENTARAGKQSLSHWSITRILLKYIVSPEFQQVASCEDQCVKPPKRLFEIAEYAVLFWPAHYRRATEQDSHAAELLKLLPSGNAFGVWHGMYCQLGGEDLAQGVCDSDSLFFAAQLGFADVVDICLATRSAEDRAKAISCASWAGHLEIVKTLAQSDEMKKEPSEQHVHCLLNAIATASRRGFEDIVVFLVKYLEEAKIVPDWDPTLLCQAAEIGYNSLVKLFVKKGVAVDATLHGTTPLQLASKNGHEFIVEYLLSCGADANSRHASDSCKPILHAAAKGYIAIAKQLLSQADLNQRDSEERTALHLAALNGHLSVVNLLMKGPKSPPQLTARDMDGRTALHLAAQNGHTSIIVSLAAALEDRVNIKDDKDYTPLRLASEGGHLLVVEKILESGAKAEDIGPDKHTALYSAAVRGHEAVAQILLQRANPGSQFVDIEDVLREAAKRGFYGVCKLCILRMNKHSLNSPDDNKWTALHYAALGGHDKIITLLFEHGANTNAKERSSQTPLSIAALASKWKATRALLSILDETETLYQSKVEKEYLLEHLARYSSVGDASMADHVKTFRALLDSKVNPNVPGQNTDRKTVLHYAAEQGKVEVMKILLEYGANPRAMSDYLNWSPIFDAVMSNNKEAVKLLLPLCGGPLVQLQGGGWTPLHIAAHYAKAKVIGVILDADKKALEFEIPDGSTPLHLAYHDADSALCLLEHGAKINAKTKDGMTTLMIAAKHEYNSVVRLLVSHHADLRLVDDSKKTAAHYAALVDHFDIVQYLLNEDHTVINYQDSEGRSLLHIAVGSSLEAVELLLKPKSGEQQSYINANLQDEGGNTPLVLAIMRPDQKIVERLLTFGVDAKIRNKHGHNALLAAMKGKHEIIWKMLLNNKEWAGVDDGGGIYPTALHLLVWEGQLETVKMLVEDYGADVNAPGGLYGTPLQAAVAYGFDKAVRYLLDKGADVTQTGGIFGHALTASILFCRRAQYISEFLEKGAVINHQDDQGRSVMHIAAWYGNLKIFQTLKEAGGSITLKDRQGRSVLHHAAAGGSTSILKQLLLDQDVLKLNDKDVNGWLPLHWACRKKENHDTVRFLTEKAQDSWAQIETPLGWTPENIAIFHLAGTLIPEEKRTKDKKWKIGEWQLGLNCKGCLLRPIYGLRWTCNTCQDFRFCFKCAWTRVDIYPYLEFEKVAQGPETKPEFEIDKWNSEAW